MLGTSSTEAAMDTIAAATIPNWWGCCSGDRDAVFSFCREFAIETEIETAFRLVQQHFSPERWQIDLEGDPEGDSRWLVLRFDARGDVSEVLATYSELKDEWLSSAHPKAWPLVRFMYNIT
jgi:hypothetical protein